MAQNEAKMPLIYVKWLSPINVQIVIGFKEPNRLQYLTDGEFDSALGLDLYDDTCYSINVDPECYKDYEHISGIPEKCRGLKITGTLTYDEEDPDWKFSDHYDDFAKGIADLSMAEVVAEHLSNLCAIQRFAEAEFDAILHGVITDGKNWDNLLSSVSTIQKILNSNEY